MGENDKHRWNEVTTGAQALTLHTLGDELALTASQRILACLASLAKHTPYMRQHPPTT
jgi:hypothetical protein